MVISYKAPLKGANLCSTFITPMPLVKSGIIVLWGVRERSLHSKTGTVVVPTIIITRQPVSVKWRSHKVHQQQGQDMKATTKAKEEHVRSACEKRSEITKEPLMALLSGRLAGTWK